MPFIYFTPNLRRHTECPDEPCDGTTVAELFERYFARWPQVRGYVLDDQGHVRHHVKVLVDGRNLLDRAAQTDTLAAASCVHVFQALSGG